MPRNGPSVPQACFLCLPRPPGPALVGVLVDRGVCALQLQLPAPAHAGRPVGRGLEGRTDERPFVSAD